MKLFPSKFAALLLCLLPLAASAAITDSTAASDSIVRPTRYEQRIDKYINRHMKFIPTHTRLQFYGGMGVVSLGSGWDYGKREQWETDILIGIVPKYNAGHNHLTFTLKQGFHPWTLKLNDAFTIEPLSCGAYFCAIAGDEFWTSQPDRYPDGYYWFSTRVQPHFFIGQSVGLDIPDSKRIRFKKVTLFYEVNTNMSYILSKVNNSYPSLADILHLSLGLKYRIF